jgi:hypothetical protein
MAYGRRKRIYKKRLPKKPVAMSDAQMAWALAKRAWEGLKYIKGLVNSELYKADIVANPNVATTGAGYFNSFNLIHMGDGDGARTGNSILCKGLRFACSIRNATATPIPWTRIRVMIMQDTQTIGDVTAPFISDILESTGASVCLSALNSETVGRYNVLFDRVYTMDTITKPQVVVKKSIKLNTHIRFNGHLNTDVQKNNIFYVILCDNVNVAFNNPVLEQVTTRIFYHDN